MRAKTKQFTFHQATNKDLLELHTSFRGMTFDPEVPVKRGNDIIREGRFGRYFAYVARDKTGRLAGFVTYRITPERELEILRKGLATGLEKNGIGSKLFGLMQSHAKKMGAKIVSVNSVAGAVGFYVRSGFPAPHPARVTMASKRNELVALEKMLPSRPRIRKRR